MTEKRVLLEGGRERSRQQHWGIRKRLIPIRKLGICGRMSIGS